MPGDNGRLILDNRYALTQEERIGGMAFVTKAADLHNGTFVAVKRMRPGGDESRKQESINREVRALQELRHPNIVTLIDAGRTPDGDIYLVLEWLDQTLAQVLTEHGPYQWHDYYGAIGSPLLDAISFAHRLGWVHRDIKPQNILFSSSGTPKLTDYGIARDDDVPQIGITFARFASEPYTPPEPDDGRYSYSRDCYSFAAVSVHCLLGRQLQNYNDLAVAVLDVDPALAPRDALESALSLDPAARQQHGGQLRGEIELFERHREQLNASTHVVYLRLSPASLHELARHLGTNEQKDIEEHLIKEIHEAFAVDVSHTGNEDKYRIYAVTWMLEAIRPQAQPHTLQIQRAARMWSSDLERLRQRACQADVTFSFRTPFDQVVAEQSLNELQIQIAEAHAAKQQLAKNLELERVFRGWYSFLRARSDFEARRQTGIEYELIETDGSRVTVRADRPVPEELIGCSHLVKMPDNRFLLFDLVDIRLDEITLQITLGTVDEVPKRSRLELNTFAEERALEKQRQALDSVYYERAASPTLKRLIASPRETEISRPSPGLPVSIDDSIDDDKVKVLEKALALRELMVVKGPPGTGKTRLIEELIIQYLSKYPEHRILLSSQTHIALDNVLVRLAKRNPDLDMVRVGRPDDPRINDKCRALLLEYKVEQWALLLRERAEAYLEQWAIAHGINKDEADTAILAERLIKAIEERERLEIVHAELENKAGAARTERRRRLEETGTDESVIIDRNNEEIATQLADTSAAIMAARRSEHAARERLKDISDYGRELSDAGRGVLEEWISVLLGRSSDEEQYRRLLSLQEEWLIRAGRSSDFFAATLSGAHVVAGTCIGLAGVRGFNNVSYDLCIVDEASKATATEVLVPMARARKWILVGDPEQLPPFFDSELSASFEDLNEPEMRETLLDRFIKGLPSSEVAELTIQHRMIKAIGDLISHCFYDDALKSEKIRGTYTAVPMFPKPVTWLSTSDRANRAQTSVRQSYKNALECKVIREVLGRLNFLFAKRKQRPCEVALIAGYVEQVKALRDAIRDHIHEWSSMRVVCSTVDALQGQEADVCIYSVTRSNPEGRLGFLREKPRLNVALSRAKDVLIVVGDADFCKSAEGENPFRDVIEYIEAHPDTCEVRKYSDA